MTYSKWALLWHCTKYAPLTEDSFVSFVFLPMAKSNQVDDHVKRLVWFSIHVANFLLMSSKFGGWHNKKSGRPEHIESFVQDANFGVAQLYQHVGELKHTTDRK